MNVSQGVQNELNFVYEIDNHKYCELNNNLRFFISYLFPHVKDEDLLHCFKTEDFIKPDICIQWKSQNAFVSLKYGISETVHGESLTSFVDFLRSLNCEERILNTIKLFAFGDGTLDGTGKIRKSGFDVRFELRDEIQYLNEKLNENKELVKKVVDRLLFKGVNPLAYSAQYIYDGSIDSGDFVSRNQIMKHIDKKSWDFMDCPHIGPIVFRPHARYASKTILNEKYRNELKFTWPRLLMDIRYISKRYNW